MSDPIIALVMLGLFIVFIFLGFPIAFTLMAMGIMFGAYAYYVPGQSIFDNNIFYLFNDLAYCFDGPRNVFNYFFDHVDPNFDNFFRDATNDFAKAAPKATGLVLTKFNNCFLNTFDVFIIWGLI